MQAKLLLIGTLLMVAGSIPEAFASRARAKTMIDRLIEERRQGRITSIDRIEFEQRRFESQVERLLRQRSGLSSTEMNMSTVREYVSRYETSRENLDALADVLQSITARGNVVPAQQAASANVLAQAAKLNQRGEFMLEPRDILQIDRNWTMAEKDQLADVVREARQIVEGNPGKSSNKAFEEALANRGLLEKFRKRCQ